MPSLKVYTKMISIMGQTSNLSLSLGIYLLWYHMVVSLRCRLCVSTTDSFCRR